MNIRQSILLRTDLNLPKGLSEAQVAHLHFEMFRNLLLNDVTKLQADNDFSVKLTIDKTILEWLNTPYIYVHGVPNMEVLRHFVTQANTLKVPYTEWRDTINVKVSDTQTIVVENCLVGVAFLGDSDKIKAVIGDLPLLR